MIARTTTDTQPVRRPWVTLPAAVLAVLAGLAFVAPAAASYGDPAGEPAPSTPSETSYSYFRVTEGPATLTQGDTGEREAVEINQPLLVGDRVWVPVGSRLELVLSDGNLLRLGGGTEVVFTALAGSPDRQDRETVIRLLDGDLQLMVFSEALGEEAPRIETANATVYVQGEGVVRVAAGREDWSRVTVRDGWAEVVTDRGSLLVRAGEQAEVEGGTWPRAAVRGAGPEDELELWGHRLVAEAERASLGPVDGAFTYSSAVLEDHGEWFLVEGQRAWRPRVAAGWRPYWSGRWSYTPSGLLWVSYEPWGWVPYHYGSWRFHPLHGWIWYPGWVFSPAWVYWYWGPTHVAWVPVGYYSHYYAPRFGFFHGLHHGFYGYAGGAYSHFRHWSFCAVGDFHRRDLHRYLHDGQDFGRSTRRDAVPRGVITTDTGGIPRARLLRPETVGDDLARRAGERRIAVPRGGPPGDVTPFVARQPELPGDLARRLVADSPETGRRVAGTPLAPGTGIARRGAATGARTPRSDRPAGVTPGGAPGARSSSPRDRTPTAMRPGEPPTSRRLRPTPPATVESRRPTAARPAEPVSPGRLRPSAPSAGADDRPPAVRPARPETPRRLQPATPGTGGSRRPALVGPATPPSGSTMQRPPAARPAPSSPPSQAAPAPRRPTTVRPAAPVTPRRPAVSERPRSVRPTTPVTPRGSARATPSPTPPRPSSVRPPAPSGRPSAGLRGVGSTAPAPRPSTPSTRSGGVRGGGRSSAVTPRGSSGRGGSTVRGSSPRSSSPRSGTAHRRSAGRSRSRGRGG